MKHGNTGIYFIHCGNIFATNGHELIQAVRISAH